MHGAAYVIPMPIFIHGSANEAAKHGTGLKRAMTINQMKRMMRAGLLAIMSVGMFGISTATPPVHAQAVPRQSPPEPPPELPSVSDYSLPPGDNQTAPDNTAEGPVEENAAPPQAVPVQNNGLSGVPTDIQPASVRPLPEASAPSETSPQGNPPTSVTSQPDARSTVTAPIPATPSANESQPTPGFSTELPNQNTAAKPPSSDVATESPPISARPAAAATNTMLYYAAGAIVLLLLCGAGFYLWRRRSAEKLGNIEMADEPEALTDVDPEPAPRKPVPKIYSPPNPAEQQKPAAIDSNGFVTSKIGVAPKPSPTVNTKPPLPTSPPAQKAATSTQQADYLQITFTASGASSTLLNAVLDYAITLTNRSDQELRDIRLSGAMMQADTETVRSGEVNSDDLLEKIAFLSPGETVELTGNIRLPLNAIRPITFKSQALFIPLARFVADYHGQDGSELQQMASFIVGREYDPPRPKMAPFRLDLGPGSFGPVGQRALKV